MINLPFKIMKNTQYGTIGQRGFRGDSGFPGYPFPPWWEVKLDNGETIRYEVADGKVHQIDKTATVPLFNCITTQIEMWAKDNSIDLSNPTDEDNVLIAMKWDKFIKFVTPPYTGVLGSNRNTGITKGLLTI